MGGDDDDSTILIENAGETLAALRQEVGERPAALIVVGGALGGTVHDLEKEETSVGRSADNSIVLDVDGVSRHHFRIIQREEGPFLEDNGSKNGTFLNNGRLSAPAPLSKGDVVKVGNVTLKYIPKNDPERLAYDRLRWEAERDRHTECYNKVFFNGVLEDRARKAKLLGSPLSLVLIDLDHFKGVNDTHGHDAGDFVLKEVARVVREGGVRGDDVFARYGGEEFVILLPGTPLKQALGVAERLRRLVEGHVFAYEDKELRITASLGVAQHDRDMATGTDLFKKADAAVYRAKENGRNNVQGG